MNFNIFSTERAPTAMVPEAYAVPQQLLAASSSLLLSKTMASPAAKGASISFSAFNFIHALLLLLFSGNITPTNSAMRSALLIPQGEQILAELDAFLKTNDFKYFAGIFIKGMKGDPKIDPRLHAVVKSMTSAAAINKLVSAATDGQISKPVNDNDLNADALIVSALYFHADWEQAFRKEDTEENGVWHAYSGETHRPLMHATFDSIYYRSTEAGSSIRLTYKNSNVTAIVSLPKENTAESMQALVKATNDGEWALAGFSRGKAIVTMPRFKVESELDGISQVLEAAGLPYSGTYDVAGSMMSISRVVHWCVVDVDEKGTTAKAVTKMMMVRSCINAPREMPFVFNANRPFLFELYYGTVPLFASLVN